MKECPHCYEELPDDSVFCTCCGKSLEEVESVSQDVEKLKEKSRKNSWDKLGLLFFLFALIGLDCILASIIATLGFDATFVFIISLFVYVLAMTCGIITLVINYQDRKNGYRQTGNHGFALVSIAVSLYIALTNLSSVILK